MSIAASNGASGASVQQEALDVITHNIANSQTPGFKAQMLLSTSNDYVTEKSAGTLSSNNDTLIPTGIQKGLGVRTQAVVSKFIQGRPVQTNNEYHMMIQGKGYFQIELPNGDIAYTRDGTFTLNQDRTLVTQVGFPVVPAIAIPENIEYISIDVNGAVTAKVAGELEPQNLGNIELAVFVNEGGLRRADNNMLLETPASGPPVIGIPGEDNRGSILQGYYEGSNVEMVLQVTKLMETQRSFDLNIKSVKAANEMLGNLSNI